MVHLPSIPPCTLSTSIVLPRSPILSCPQIPRYLHHTTRSPVVPGGGFAFRHCGAPVERLHSGLGCARQAPAARRRPRGGNHSSAALLRCTPRASIGRLLPRALVFWCNVRGRVCRCSLVVTVVRGRVCVCCKVRGEICNAGSIYHPSIDPSGVLNRRCWSGPPERAVHASSAIAPCQRSASCTAAYPKPTYLPTFLPTYPGGPRLGCAGLYAAVVCTGRPDQIRVYEVGTGRRAQRQRNMRPYS
jgi:hypothetical protein